MKRDCISHNVFKIVLYFCELTISLGAKKQIKAYKRLPTQNRCPNGTTRRYRVMLGRTEATFSLCLFQYCLLVSRKFSYLYSLFVFTNDHNHVPKLSVQVVP